MRSCCSRRARAPSLTAYPQYEKDCKMQMIAVEFAKEYNKLGPPKAVEFLEAFMLQVTSHASQLRAP